MKEISTAIIKEAVYNLCFLSNICLNGSVYKKVSDAYFKAESDFAKSTLQRIMQNAKIAYEKKMPLCQDTGQVIVFLNIGQSVKLTGGYIEDAVNEAVEESYRDNYFRKSVVKNAVFNRVNTKTNTPAVIHTKIVRGDAVNIKVLIKGAGSENKSGIEMFLPTVNEDEFIQSVGKFILSAGENACPPMFIGIGAGLNAEGAMLLSKQALICDKFSQEETELSEKIKHYVNTKAPKKYSGSYVLDVKVLTSSTHIASLPVAITVNCHSERFSECSIKDGKIIYRHNIPDFIKLPEETEKEEVFADDTERIKALKNGANILLSGEIYVARDMAHKKLYEMIENGDKLPFEVKDKIILYAGPCPKKEGQITGSIGPTTASRMDKYAVLLYKEGLIATIGKGNRSGEIYKLLRETGAKYFSLQGGVAALLAQKIKSSEIVAFPELGAEAVYKIEAEKLPLTVKLT